MEASIQPESAESAEQASMPAVAVVSKNQMKRKLKEERQQSIKKAKKQAEKARKQAQKQLIIRAPREPYEPQENSLPRVPRKEHKEAERVERLNKMDKNWSIVIDCAWEDIHADRPLVSLAQQLMFCYGVNNRAVHPCRMHLTGVGSRLQQKLDRMNANLWLGVDVSSQEYSIPRFHDKQLVYLTSDATQVLSDLDTNTCYIIGGIVDRNAHKGITLLKAQQQNIVTAKLPIKEHCELSASTVLTVNHIFAIMIHYAESRDWSQAIRSVIPSRKQLSIEAPSEHASACANSPQELKSVPDESS